MNLYSLIETLIRWSILMQDKALSRREREKLRQRQDILQAALSLFSENGFHNVSMQEIAEKSEFAIGTLYKFFQNKEELYKAMVMERCEKFETKFYQALEEPDDEIEKLRSFVQMKSEVFRNDLDFVRLFLLETQKISFNVNMSVYPEVQERYRSMLKKIEDIFQHGIDSKKFTSSLDAPLLAVALDSITNSFHLAWLEDPEHYPFPENPDSVLNILFEGILKTKENSSTK